MRLQKILIKPRLVLPFFVFWFMTPAANAGHNWNIIQIHKETINASISIYSAFSSVYQCFVLLEKEKFQEANTVWQEEVILNIRNARNVYAESSAKLPAKYRDLVRGIPKEYQPMIFRDLGRYGIPFPFSLQDLARAAELELKKIEDSFTQIRFDRDEMENRELIRKINYEITRFISLGISFSTISKWNAQ